MDQYWNKCLRLAIRLDGYVPGHKRAIAIYLDCLRHVQKKSLMKQAFGQLQQLEADQITPIFADVRDLYTSSSINLSNSSNSTVGQSSVEKSVVEKSIAEKKSTVGKSEVERSRFCYRLLWEWADILGYQTFCRLWQVESSLKSGDKLIG